MFNYSNVGSHFFLTSYKHSLKMAPTAETIRLLDLSQSDYPYIRFKSLLA